MTGVEDENRKKRIASIWYVPYAVSVKLYLFIDSLFSIWMSEITWDGIKYIKTMNAKNRSVQSQFRISFSPLRYALFCCLFPSFSFWFDFSEKGNLMGFIEITFLSSDACIIMHLFNVQTCVYLPKRMFFSEKL